MSRGQKLVMMYQLNESKDQIKEIAKKFQIQTKTISREMIGETMGHLIGSFISVSSTFVFAAPNPLRPIRCPIVSPIISREIVFV